RRCRPCWCRCHGTGSRSSTGRAPWRSAWRSSSSAPCCAGSASAACSGWARTEVASLWAAGLLLRRLKSERGIVLLIVLLVGSTSFVFAAAPRLFNRVSDEALHFVAAAARPADRNLAMNVIGTLTPAAEGGVSTVRAYGDDLAKQIPASITGIVADRQMRITTPRFFVPSPPLLETHLSLR